MNEGRPVRVLTVISVISEDFGGPSIAAIELQRELHEQNHANLLITTSLKPDGSRLSAAEIAHFEKDGIRALSPSWPRRLQNSWKLLRAVSREARMSDVAHMHGQYLLPHVYTYFAARRAQIPYGVQPHGALEPYQRRESALRKRIYNMLIGNRILRNASYVVFSADSEAIRASDVVRDDQAVVVAHGATLPDPLEVQLVAERLTDLPRSRVVLFLGRLAKKKRPDLLIAAWSLVRNRGDAVLVLAGPDDHWTAAELRTIARERNVEDSVLFAGHLDGAQKSWLYRRSGIFVLPSENENYGITIGEAMLAGCHVITTSEVAASSLLVSAGAGEILDSPDAADLAASIESALLDPELQDSSGRRAQAYAVENISWRPLAAVLVGQAMQGRSNR